jgi:BirA family biotin operon repressor/biotin-[acetyl-CoA-carboxylase] ligase
MTRKAARYWEGETLESLRERWDRPDVYVYARIDSTNVRARELAEEDAPAGTIVIADEQVTGRGRRSRRWFSPKGAGLYLSLVLRPELLPNPTLVSLLAGLGMARAVDRLLGNGSAALKWPNDLILQDRKAGGALTETVWAGDRPAHVILGMGINVHQEREDFPPVLRDVAISLDMVAGEEVSRLELADLVLEEVEERCARIPASLEPEQLRQLDDYDWLRDRRCSVLASDEEEAEPEAGVAVGIAPDGALLFRPDTGALQRVKSGQVLAEGLRFPDY